MRMGSIPTQSRPAVSAVMRRYTDVIVAALIGGEDDIAQAVDELGTRDFARLRNAFRMIELIIDRNETRARRNRP